MSLIEPLRSANALRRARFGIGDFGCDGFVNPHTKHSSPASFSSSSGRDAHFSGNQRLPVPTLGMSVLVLEVDQ
jgi:hypothetical protein